MRRSFLADVDPRDINFTKVKNNLEKRMKQINSYKSKNFGSLTNKGGRNSNRLDRRSSRSNESSNPLNNSRDRNRFNPRSGAYSNMGEMDFSKERNNEQNNSNNFLSKLPIFNNKANSSFNLNDKINKLESSVEKILSRLEGDNNQVVSEEQPKITAVGNEQNQDNHYNIREYEHSNPVSTSQEKPLYLDCDNKGMQSIVVNVYTPGKHIIKICREGNMNDGKEYVINSHSGAVNAEGNYHTPQKYVINLNDEITSTSGSYSVKQNVVKTSAVAPKEYVINLSNCGQSNVVDANIQGFRDQTKEYVINLTRPNHSESVSHGSMYLSSEYNHQVVNSVPVKYIVNIGGNNTSEQSQSIGYNISREQVITESLGVSSNITSARDCPVTKICIIIK